MYIKCFVTTLLAITFLCSGCIVLSIHPFYTEETLTTDSSIEGMWRTKDGESWDIGRLNYSYYHVSIIDKGELVGFMDGTLFEVKGKTFMDMYPYSFETTVNGHSFNQIALTNISSETISDLDLWWNKIHLLPTHSVMRVVKSGPDTLLLALLDLDWMHEQLEKNPSLIKHEIPGSWDIEKKEAEVLMLTASPQELQTFIAKYAENEEAFPLETLVRVK